MLRPEWRARNREVLAQAGAIDDPGRVPSASSASASRSGSWRRNPCQEAAKLLTQAVVRLPDHPEVDDSDAPRRLDEEVAGMRIGVEEPVLEDHLGGDQRRSLGELVAVEAGFVERRRSVIFMPRIRSSVITREVVRSGKTRGIWTHGSPAKLAAKRSALRASCR